MRRIKTDALDLCKEDIPMLQELLEDLKEHNGVTTPIRSVYDGCWQEWELADDWTGAKEHGPYPDTEEE